MDNPEVRLTTSEVADIMNIPKESAPTVLRACHIEPCSRVGRALLWSAREIRDLADRMYPKAAN